MTEGIDTRMLEPDGVQIAFSWFLRAVSVFCLVVGVGYWIRLIGFYPGDEWRFDLMPLHWQIAAPLLSVLMPFAAVGLWMLTSWGPVVWMLCAGTEIIMFAAYPHLFGDRPVNVIVHIVVSIGFIGFFSFIYWRRWKSEY